MDMDFQRQELENQQFSQCFNIYLENKSCKRSSSRPFLYHICISFMFNTTGMNLKYDTWSVLYYVKELRSNVTAKFNWVRNGKNLIVRPFFGFCFVAKKRY